MGMEPQVSLICSSIVMLAERVRVMPGGHDQAFWSIGVSTQAAESKVRRMCHAGSGCKASSHLR